MDLMLNNMASILKCRDFSSANLKKWLVVSANVVGKIARRDILRRYIPDAPWDVERLAPNERDYGCSSTWP